MRYIIAPLDLTTEQREIYWLLYSKSDFKTFEVKYTLDQLVSDSNIKLELTKKKVSKIIKDFINLGYINEIEKGVKGKATIYKIITIKEQIGNELEMNRERIGTNREQITIDAKGFEGCQGTNRERIGTNRERIGNELVTPIKEKDKEKEKEYIYIPNADKVKLTQEQYDKLINDYPKNIIDKKILDMDNYVTQKNKPYKDYNKAIRTWLRNEKIKPINNNSTVKENWMDWN